MNFSFDSGQVRCISSSHIVRFSPSFGRGIGGRYNTRLLPATDLEFPTMHVHVHAESGSWPEGMVSLCRFQKLTIYVHIYLKSRYMQLSI